MSLKYSLVDPSSRMTPLHLMLQLKAGTSPLNMLWNLVNHHFHYSMTGYSLLALSTPLALGKVPFFKETIWDDWSQKYNLPGSTIDCIQVVQNSCAKFLTRAKRFDSASEQLKNSIGFR